MATKRPHNFNDLTGQTFGRLVALEHVGTAPDTGALWRCRCQCGAIADVAATYLRNGRTASCGCLAVETSRDRQARHGHTTATCTTPEYNCWRQIKARCCRPSCKQYPTHGGRGIKVCDEWLDFEAFLADVGYRPSDRHRLYRLDQDGDFNALNCAWLLPKERPAGTAGAGRR
jgi:hypothetical protein